MRLLSLNVNGIIHKYDAINDLINQSKIDIACFQEHWLEEGSTIPVMQQIAATYESKTGFLPRNSGRRNKGGLAILAKPKYCNQITVIEQEKNYIHIKYGEIHIFNVYFPPSTEDTILENFLDHLELFEEDEVVVVGDFNARIGALAGDSVENARGRILLHHMADSNYFLQTPVSGTFTCIGNAGKGVFTMNLEVQDYKIRYDTPAISDHVPLQFNIKVNQVYANNYNRWNVREFEKPESRTAYNEETNLQIDAIQWHEINSVEDLWTAVKR
jgi:hypothetical protein